jgi:prevent-host-death family protein
MDPRTEETTALDFADEESVTAKHLKANLSEYLGRTQYNDAFFVITKNGKPAAALVPLYALAACHRLEDEYDLKKIAEHDARDAANGEKNIPISEVRERLGL